MNRTEKIVGDCTFFFFFSFKKKKSSGLLKKLDFDWLCHCGFNTDGVGQLLFQVETDLGGDGEGHRGGKRGKQGPINYFLL